MPRPIIGIGHSMGGCMLTNLALIQPRLLSGLILIDPVIAATQGRSNWSPARASSGRRDLWPSRDAAASAFAKSKFYQTWDKRVLDLWTEHGLRDLPTALYPSAEGEDKQVTLRTSKHQEVHSFARPTYRAASDRDGPNRPPTRSTHPDLPIAVAPSRALPFYRPEPASVFARLPNLHPGTLYVFGAHSDLSTTVDRAEKLALTGTGVGGSGGAREGRVKEVVLDAGHLVPMERVGETASAAAEWIASELNRFEDEKRDVRQELENVPLDQRARMSPRFVELISGRKGSQAGKPKI
ncbi:hypothetical protein ANO11243_015590 [Dothideomycetidae sp. 11243]|nr:hypothetical protein ANO11243_015590 [fungal sp. No.11243]